MSPSQRRGCDLTTPFRAALSCLVLLAVGMFVVHTFYWIHPAWWKVLGTMDSHRQFGPQYFFVDYWLHRGVLPLWNPMILCGVPLCANPEAGLFYPVNLLRSVLVPGPTPLATHVSLLLMNVFHLFVAGLGVFLLARRHRMSFAGAMIAVFAFVFSCSMTRRLPEHFNIVAVIAWAPWILLLVHAALASSILRTRSAYAVGAGLVFGLSTLGGHTDYTVYIALMIFVYVVLHRVLWPRDGVDPQGEGRCTLLAKDALVFVVVAGVALAIALPVVLPAAELAGYSGRTPDSGYRVHELANLDGPWEGAPAYRDPWYLVKCHVLFAGTNMRGCELRGSGVITLLLFLAALTGLRRREILLFLGVYLVLFDVSLEAPLSIGRLVRALCPYQIGFPFRAILIMQLPFAMLAGMGFDVLLRSIEEGSRWTRVRFALMALAGLFCFAVLARHLQAGNAFGVSWSALIVPLAGMGVLALCYVAGAPRWWRGIVPALVLVEAAVWTPPYQDRLFHRPESLCEIAPATLAQPRQYEPANRRGVDYVQNHATYDLRPVMNGYVPLHLREVVERLHADPEQGFGRSVEATEPTAAKYCGNLLLKRRFWLAREYVAGPLPADDVLFPPTELVFLRDAHVPDVPRAAMAPACSVSQDMRITDIPLPEALAQPVPMRAGEGTACALPAIPLEAVHSAMELRCASDVVGTLRLQFEDADSGEQCPGRTQRLEGGGVETRFEIPLPDYRQLRCTLSPIAAEGTGSFHILGLRILSDLSDENGLITIAAESANRIDLDIGPLSGPRVLLFVDAAYPGWKAYVDGERAPLLRADDVFKAVAVPAGAHHIRFVFRPWRVYVGVAVSLAALAGCAAYLMVFLRRCPRPLSSNHCV